MTRSDFAASASVIICGSTDGTICQDKPYLSLSQPHGPSCPPSVSLLQKWSISACESHITWNETASLNLKCGPPLRAVKLCPSISNSTVITEPASLPCTSWPALVKRLTCLMREFSNTDV